MGYQFLQMGAKALLQEGLWLSLPCLRKALLKELMQRNEIVLCLHFKYQYKSGYFIHFNCWKIMGNWKEWRSGNDQFTKCWFRLSLLIHEMLFILTSSHVKSITPNIYILIINKQNFTVMPSLYYP